MKPVKQKLGPNQEKWLKALESGKYKQGKGYLCRIDNGKPEYCCLGVAAKVFLGEGKQLKTKKYISWKNNFQSAPVKVQQLLQLYDKYGAGAPTYDDWSLVDLNDEGFTFKQIAKMIRKNPDAFFKKPA